MLLDLNRLVLSDRPINRRLNELIEAAEPPNPTTGNISEHPRSDPNACAVSNSTGCAIRSFRPAPAISLRVDISSRKLSRQHLIAAGFKFASKVRLKFETAGGLFRGHADGILVVRTALPDLIYPVIWETRP